MTVCVVGAKGMLGTDLCGALGSGRAVGVDLPEVDITDARAIRATLAQLRPSAVVNCAAYTRVDDCETHREVAYAINRDGAAHVAAAAAGVDARLVQISTDYVFDGTATAPIREDARTNPQSVYGASKLAGEEAVRAACPDAIIVRTAWLYGHHGPNFIETILRVAAERDRLTVVNDQQGTPTATKDLAEGLVRLLDVPDATGIFHVTNTGSCTWYDFACFIVEQAGITVPVDPMTSDQLDRPAPRPAYSVLDCTRFTETTGAPLPPWRDAVAAYVAARRARLGGGS